MSPGTLASLRHDLLAIGGGFFLLLVLGGVVSFFAHSKYVLAGGPQPVVFDHRLHVEEQGMECSSCHAYFETETFSGLPPLATCALCHSEPQGDSPEEAKVVRAIEEGREIVWQRLFRQPPHVFFSHRRHVVVAELECTACHGDIGSSSRPPERPARLTMDQCIDCHDRSAVAQDCSACHR